MLDYKAPIKRPRGRAKYKRYPRHGSLKRRVPQLFKREKGRKRVGDRDHDLQYAMQVGSNFSTFW
jgi:hypothetical protein